MGITSISSDAIATCAFFFVEFNSTLSTFTATALRHPTLFGPILTITTICYHNLLFSNGHNDVRELAQFQRAETLAVLKEEADQLLMDRADTDGGGGGQVQGQTKHAVTSIDSKAAESTRANGGGSGSGSGSGSGGGSANAAEMTVGVRVQAWGIIGPPEALRKYDVRPGLGTEIAVDTLSASMSGSTSDVVNGDRNGGGLSGSGQRATSLLPRPSAVVAEVSDDAGTVYCSDWYDGVVVGQRAADGANGLGDGSKEPMYDVVFDNVAVAPAVAGGAGLPGLLVRPQGLAESDASVVVPTVCARTDSGDEYSDATDITDTPGGRSLASDGVGGGGGGGGGGSGGGGGAGGGAGGDGDGFHDCDDDGATGDDGGDFGESDGEDDGISLPVLSIESYNPSWPSMPVMSLDGK